jgi:hypothetical protein
VRNASRLATLLLLGSIACARQDGSPLPGTSFPAENIRRGSAIPLRPVAESPADLSFTAVDGLDVDSRGTIYVPDAYQQRVVVLGPDASFIRTFGRRGSGPGEFRAVARVQVLPGDSLLAYDPALARYSVYAPDSTRPAYTVNLGARLDGPSPYDVIRTHANTALVAYFRPPFAFLPGATFDARRDHVRVLEVDGTPRADVVRHPSRGFLVAGTSVTPDPFGSEGFVRLDSRDRLHYLWSDSVAVERYDLNGTRLGGFRIPNEASPVTRRDVADAVSELHPLDRARFEPVLRDSLPGRWPAVRQLLMDDRDRLWMQMGGSRGRPTEWAAFSSEGAYLESFVVPPGDQVLSIRGDGRVFATRLDDDDVPRVVLYRMTRPLR